ncbi:MAG: J domain-containing protein [Candidatus Woesearchaeota archaeon]
MVVIKIKTHEINVRKIKDSHLRRATQFKNNIEFALQSVGVPEDDIDVHMEVVAIRNLPASVTWYLGGRRIFYSFASASNFAENLFVVQSVIEGEVLLLAGGDKTLDEFISEFSEEDDVLLKRKEARVCLGLSEDERDMKIINKAYKDLAKEHHPDKESGSIDKFKEINNAHKILKRELT